MRKVALIILLDDRNRMLLQHRDPQAERNPSKWSFFGGGIEEGETPVEAVKRECMEELVYTLKSPKLAYTGEYPERQYHVFTERYDRVQRLTLLEGDGMRWFFINEALDLDMAKNHKEILKLIRSQFEQ